MFTDRKLEPASSGLESVMVVSLASVYVTSGRPADHFPVRWQRGTIGYAHMRSGR